MQLLRKILWVVGSILVGYTMVCQIYIHYVMHTSRTVIAHGDKCIVEQDIQLHQYLLKNGVGCSFTFGRPNPLMLEINVWTPPWRIYVRHVDWVTVITTQ